MYNITAGTYREREAINIYFISEETAIDTYNMILKAEDVYNAALIDAMTGEVIYEWFNGQFTVIDRTVVH
jgi:hypothetical protein